MSRLSRLVLLEGSLGFSADLYVELSHTVNKACQIFPKDADFPKHSLRA